MSPKRILVKDHLFETYAVENPIKHLIFMHGLWSSAEASGQTLIDVCRGLNVTLTLVTAPKHFDECTMDDATAQTLSLHDSVSAIRGFADHHRLENYIAGGHSSGGLVVQLLMNSEEYQLVGGGLLLCSAIPYISFQRTASAALLKGILGYRHQYFPAIFGCKPYSLNHVHVSEFGGETGWTTWTSKEYGRRTRECIPLLPVPIIGPFMANRWGWGVVVKPIPQTQQLVIVGAKGDQMTPWFGQKAIGRLHRRTVREYDSDSHTEILSDASTLAEYVTQACWS